MAASASAVAVAPAITSAITSAIAAAAGVGSRSTVPVTLLDELSRGSYHNDGSGQQPAAGLL